MFIFDYKLLTGTARKTVGEASLLNPPRKLNKLMEPEDPKHPNELKDPKQLTE